MPLNMCLERQKVAGKKEAEREFQSLEVIGINEWAYVFISLLVRF